MRTAVAPKSNVGRNRLWAVTALASLLAIVFAGSWALSSPVGASPDDNYHLTSIWCGQGFREGICESTANASIVRVPEAVARSSSCYAFDPTAIASCDYSDALISTDRSNISGGYPPIYYWSMSHLVGADVQSSVIAMRLFAALVAIIGVAIAVVIAPVRLKLLPLVGLFFTMTPLGSFLIASNNPSGWAYAGVIVFFSAMTTFLASESRSSTVASGVLAIGSVIIGAGSRADAALYIVLVLGVSWILMGHRKRIDGFSVALSAVVMALSVSFYLNAGQSSVLIREQSNPGFDVGNFVSNLLGLPGFWAGALGTWGLGWLDTAMPATVFISTVSLYFAIFFASLRSIDIRGAVSVSLVALALVVVPLYVLTRENILIGVGVQPRYILPLLPILIMAAWFPARGKDALKPSLPQICVVLFGLWVANAIALHVNIRRYVTGIDVTSGNLDANVEWWWSGLEISPMGVWLTGTIVFGILLVTVAGSFKMFVPLNKTRIDTQRNP